MYIYLSLLSWSISLSLPLFSLFLSLSLSFSPFLSFSLPFSPFLFVTLPLFSMSVSFDYSLCLFLFLSLSLFFSLASFFFVVSLSLSLSIPLSPPLSCLALSGNVVLSSSRGKKNNKHKQLFGIALGTGGGQNCCLGPFALEGGGRKHINKRNPRKYHGNAGTVP